MLPETHEPLPAIPGGLWASKVDGQEQLQMQLFALSDLQDQLIAGSDM